MYKKSKINRIFTSCGIFLLLAFCFTFYGCNYGGMVNLSEQIAIYQNMGFTKTQPSENIVNFGDITINVLTTKEINQRLKELNANTSVNNYIVLSLIKEDELCSLLYLYYFDNNTLATNFYNAFISIKEDLQIIDNTVLQKGHSPYLKSQAENLYYFLHFYNTLKK